MAVTVETMGTFALLTADDLAVALGVRRRTVDSYRARGILPAPDRHVGRVALWRPSTIADWRAARPGRGRGGGRYSRRSRPVATTD